MPKVKDSKSKKSSKKKHSDKLVLSKGEFYRLKPVISPFIQIKEKNDKELLVVLDITELKQRSKKYFSFRNIIPSPNFRKISLDKLGMDVFLSCDGKNDVNNIIADFQQKYMLTLTETRASVQKFLMSLAERHLIGFTIPPDIVKKNHLSDEKIEKIVIEK